MSDPNPPCVELGGLHTIEAVEVAHIAAVLARLPLAKAAKVLGIERTTLNAKRRKYGIPAPCARRVKRSAELRQRMSE
jgi:DNA-binding NtrC family response regulator